jgi:hypothetical protein
MLPSTKNFAPTLGVDKKMFVRKILHVLKDGDLSLNKCLEEETWAMQKYEKNYIWTYESPRRKKSRDT